MNPPQSGAKTHTQDQSITPINFRVTKTIVKRPKNPIFIVCSTGFHHNDDESLRLVQDFDTRSCQEYAN